MSQRNGVYLDNLAQLPALLAAWQANSPQAGVLLLLPEAEAASIPALQLAAKTLNLPLLGALFPAIIADGRFVSQGVCVLRFDQMPPWFLLADIQAGDAEAGQKIAKCSQALLAELTPAATPTLFTIFDGMLPHIETMLMQLYGELGEQVEYAGVNAGSETFQSVPCLFDTERLLANAVIGILLPAATEVVLEHGYIRSKSILSATSSAGNRVDTIAYRPAFDVYQEVIRAEYGIQLTQENFYDYAAHFPFGVKTVSDTLVRIPISFSADGSLFFIGEIPPLSLLVLLKAPELAQSQCVEVLAKELGFADAPNRDNALLVFYCAGRRMHYQTDASREVSHLQNMTGAPCLIGALSLGEIDTIREYGLPRFHNAAIVCVRAPAA